jgi:hypothetical protein
MRADQPDKAEAADYRHRAGRQQRRGEQQQQARPLDAQP